MRNGAIRSTGNGEIAMTTTPTTTTTTHLNGLGQIGNRQRDVAQLGVAVAAQEQHRKVRRVVQGLAAVRERVVADRGIVATHATVDSGAKHERELLVDRVVLDDGREVAHGALVSRGRDGRHATHKVQARVVGIVDDREAEMRKHIVPAAVANVLVGRVEVSLEARACGVQLRTRDLDHCLLRNLP